MKTETQPSLEQMRVEVCEWFGVESDTGFPVTINWLHDFNKCFNRLTVDQQKRYIITLFEDLFQFKKCYERFSVFDIIGLESATAPQRLLALWRTIKGL